MWFVYEGDWPAHSGGLTKNTYCHLVVTTMTMSRGGGLTAGGWGEEKEEKKTELGRLFLIFCM